MKLSLNNLSLLKLIRLLNKIFNDAQSAKVIKY